MQKRRILIYLAMVPAILLPPIGIPIYVLTVMHFHQSRHASIPQPRRAPDEQRRRSMHSLRHPHPQLQSPLFRKLPPEIRQQIFQWIVQIEEPLLIASTCKCRSKKSIPRDRSRTCQKEKCRMFLSWRKNRRLRLSDAIRPVPLLRTCARVYSEVLPLLYGANTFKALDQNAVVLVSRLAGGPWIKRLDCSAGEFNRFYAPRRDEPSPEWIECCVALARLTQLRWLRIDLSYLFSNSILRDMWSESAECAMWQQLKSLLPPGARGELVLDVPRGHSAGQSAEVVLDGSGWEVMRPD